MKHLVDMVVHRPCHPFLTPAPHLWQDDPAILAWETGNELNFDEINPGLPTAGEMDAWVQELSAFIKDIDSNHLVMDGRLLNNQVKGPGIDRTVRRYSSLIPMLAWPALSGCLLLNRRLTRFFCVDRKCQRWRWRIRTST
jgi:hypothetical protein